MASTESPRCEECGAVFDTIEDLNEHQKAEAEDNLLRHKKFSDG